MGPSGAPRRGALVRSLTGHVLFVDVEVISGGFRQVSVVEVREVLRGWLEGAGLRKVAERAGGDRKTARRYVAAAQTEGLVREAGGEGQPALSIVKIQGLLARQGCVVPYRTLHRFPVVRCGSGVKSTTVRVNDGEPGMECQIDFAQMGFIVDLETGKKRRVHALIRISAHGRAT